MASRCMSMNHRLRPRPTDPIQTAALRVDLIDWLATAQWRVAQVGPGARGRNEQCAHVRMYTPYSR